MATAVTMDNELADFHRFLGQHLARGNGRMTLDEAVAEFRAYQDELERCREAIRPALEASLRGESTPLDIDDIKRRGTERYQERTRAN